MTVAEEVRLPPLGDGAVSTSEAVLDPHAGDLSYHPRHAPDAVALPATTDEVAAVLAWANGAFPSSRSAPARSSKDT